MRVNDGYVYLYNELCIYVTMGVFISYSILLIWREQETTSKKSPPSGYLCVYPLFLQVKLNPKQVSPSSM